MEEKVMTTKRERIRKAFLSGKIHAICGYPGIGKTYLTNIDKRFVDGFFSKQYYADKKLGIVNLDFPDNYRKFCKEQMAQGKIVVCAMHPMAREVFESLRMNYLIIYPDEWERQRYFKIYDTRPDEKEWAELNKTTWFTKIRGMNTIPVPNGCFKDIIPDGMTLTDYLQWLGIVHAPDTASLLQTLDGLAIPEDASWWDAQKACEIALQAEFRGGAWNAPFGKTTAIAPHSMQPLAPPQ